MRRGAKQICCHFLCLKPFAFVWFAFSGVWCLKCNFIKTLDKHWTRPGSVCSALHFVGLGIVAATTLQIFVGTVKGQARVWDQVLKLTKAPLQQSVWGPSPLRDCFIEVFLRARTPRSSVPPAPCAFKTPLFLLLLSRRSNRPGKEKKNCLLLVRTGQHVKQLSHFTVKLLDKTKINVLADYV